MSCDECIRSGFSDLAVEKERNKDSEWLVISGFQISVDDLVRLGKFLDVVKREEWEECLADTNVSLAHVWGLVNDLGVRVKMLEESLKGKEVEK